MHAVLFPSITLLDVHAQHTRSRALTVAITHPGTNAHNCSLTSSSHHTTIYPLGHSYLWMPIITRCHHYASPNNVCAV